MKKYTSFLGIFVLAFVGLQFLSGMLMTLFYTPTVTWEMAGNLPSQIEFGQISMIPLLVISLVALGVAYGATKHFGKKIVQ